jgi:NodT family efflux transporter outer membrane factor (OMF) lipoprotein
MLHLSKTAGALLLATALSACSLGPDFTAPAAPSAARYTAPDEGAPAGQAVALGAKVSGNWWALFKSPELDQLVRQAVAASPTLEAAKARLASARSDVAAASGGLYPQVNAGASATREKINTSGFGLRPSVFPLPPNFNVFQVGPSVSYDLDIFGGTKRGIERQNALADYQREQLDAAYLTLTGNVVTRAIEVASVRAQIKALEDILAIDRQNLGLARTARDAGTVPDSDVVTAEAQLAADETMRPGLDQQLSVARHALAVLLGRAPADWTPPDLPLDGLTLPPTVPVSLPSELVHQRPDIQAAEAQLHAASAQIGIATARLYPAVTLSAGASAAALDPGHLFTPTGLLWSVAAGITEPVFDGGTRKAQREAALSQFKASAADYKQTVLQAFGQVADTLQALSHGAELAAAEQHAMNVAGEAVRLQRLTFGNGASGVIGLLDAQRQYQQARLGYVRAQAQRFTATTDLLVATGGGWADAEPPAMERAAQ